MKENPFKSIPVDIAYVACDSACLPKVSPYRDRRDEIIMTLYKTHSYKAIADMIAEAGHKPIDQFLVHRVVRNRVGSKPKLEQQQRRDERDKLIMSLRNTHTCRQIAEIVKNAGYKPIAMTSISSVLNKEERNKRRRKCLKTI
jgi:hypothetical protein